MPNMRAWEIRFAVCVLALMLGLAAQVRAQSSDQNLPSPVLAREITGQINALDVGDPRTTRHYYAFSAEPGDLLITLDSKNLNGDVDVFTAVTFRPLMKTTMYAASQSSEITKGIYLRTKQILILRVEARTPNDDPGTYHIRFGGTFEPFSGGIPVAENAAPDTTTEKSDPNRLSSVGATIPRPVTETTETAEAKPTAEKTPEESARATKPAEKPSRTPSRRTTARNTRRGTRTAPARRTAAPKPAPKAPEEKAEENKETPAAAAETTKSKPPTEKPANQELPQVPGTRLIIQQKDGTTINRPMSTVRRVVIEGPAIVIVLKTGKIERIAMTNVARMSIEPE